MIVLLTSVVLAAEVLVSTSPQATVDAAAPGDVVVFPEGDWPGPLVVDKALTLTSRGGRLVGHQGTTLRVNAPGVVLESLEVVGSGDDLSGPDACVFLGPDATGAVVRDSTFSDCLFGLWVHQVRGARIVNNHVIGRPDVPDHSKGNGIHLFDSEELVVRGNVVEGARDGIYVSATEDSLIADNTVSHQRYGVHYMFSYRNTITGNHASFNSGGFALMQSRELVVNNNVATDNKRQGILFRDAIASEIRGNRVERNGEGLFFFSSVENVIADNVIAHNRIGARIWAGTQRNTVENNAFVGNGEQVFYIATHDQSWGSNYWSDYLGWDQDGDGFGDRPYRSETLQARLLERFPQAVLLLSSPSLELLAFVQDRVPGLAEHTIIDNAPLMTWEP